MPATAPRTDGGSLSKEGVAVGSRGASKEENVPDHRRGKASPPHGTRERVGGVGGDGRDGTPLDEKNAQNDVHGRFVSALERHGSSAGAWRVMASELEWTVEDVKLYAYSYFKSLVRARNAKRCLAAENDVGQNEKKKGSPSSKSADGITVSPSWSFHELILLDSLMVKYCQDLSCLDGNEEIEDESSHFVRQATVWENIAAQFPGKTSASCKQKGKSRLLRVYYDESRQDKYKK
mmetsp:Transcript_21285/g.45478  ORF Transcript_21285/g.45478 Transcript_21285/m.45478 type:complete len:235 (+) Transcript_21285:103-807(+)